MSFASGRRTITSIKCSPNVQIRTFNSICVGQFPARRRTALVSTISSFDSKIYSVIISYHVEPFIYIIHDCTTDFILVQDNCRPDHAKLITAFFENEDLTRMPWPSQSPDLHPIENVWSLMKSRLRKRSTYTKSPILLFSILSEMGNSLPKSLFRMLLESTPSRLESVLFRKGRALKY